MAGLEPTLPVYPKRILSPLRLPFRHIGLPECILPSERTDQAGFASRVRSAPRGQRPCHEPKIGRHPSRPEPQIALHSFRGSLAEFVLSRRFPMTTANKITVIRILMIPVFVTLAIYYGQSIQEGNPQDWQRFAAIVIFLARRRQ